MFCGMVTIGGARGLHDRRSGRSVVGSRLLVRQCPSPSTPWLSRQLLNHIRKFVALETSTRRLEVSQSSEIGRQTAAPKLAVPFF